MGKAKQFQNKTLFSDKFFLAHLSKYSRLAFVMAYCPSSIVRPFVRASVRASTISFNNFSSDTTDWILTKLHRNDPWVVLYQIVQTVDCISRSWGLKIGFQDAIFKNLLAWNYKAQSFYIWYIASSRGPLLIFGGQHKWSSVNGSTVTFDLLLRRATQGPMGPLV